MVKILIADDEEMARSMIREILESYFKEKTIIFEAVNGKEAVKYTLAEKADIAFLDIDMPLLDGIQAGKLIKEQLHDCSVIFLTAYAQFSYAKQAISLGATEYLVKPVDSHELVSIVNRELQKHRDFHVLKDTCPPEDRGSFSEEPAEDEAENTGTDRSENRAKKIALEARKMVDTEYMREISIDELAGRFQISINHFNKIFKQFNGVPCKEYIINVRVEKAREYLKRPQLTVREAAALVGYIDSNYFSRIFKKKTGLTPLEYRNQVFFMPEEES
ncbi:MAG: response regulator [Eubacteriales bacterium]|nr:response regulator [Eubacteriales bacterium]